MPHNQATQVSHSDHAVRIPAGGKRCPEIKQQLTVGRAIQMKSEPAQRLKVAVKAMEWRIAELHQQRKRMVHPSAPEPGDPSAALDELRKVVDDYLFMLDERTTVSFTYLPDKEKRTSLDDESAVDARKVYRQCARCGLVLLSFPFIDGTVVLVCGCKGSLEAARCLELLQMEV